MLQESEQRFTPAKGFGAKQSAWFGEYGQKKIIDANCRMCQREGNAWTGKTLHSFTVLRLVLPQYDFI